MKRNRPGTIMSVMSAGKEPFSLYVHLPYCAQKCPYCDFNSHVVQTIPEEEYAGSLIKELDFYAARNLWQGRGVKTVFFGGGTPSLFSPASIDRILDKAASLFSIGRDAEITLEANPGSVESARFFGYRACGVNRISLGAQSFQPRLLRFLGRVHAVKETLAALDLVDKAGFANFNLDLIYAIPGQSVSEVEDDLTRALGFCPPHLSAYNLTLEEGTPFHRDWRTGRLHPLPEETEIAMAELVEKLAGQAGLARYEISNYAKTGRESRHNLNYWKGGDYLGIGAGAHSYESGEGLPNWGRRWQNLRPPASYMRQICVAGHAVAEEEAGEYRQMAGEFMFLGLRMASGISVEAFAHRFAKRPEELYPQLTGWLEEGFMKQEHGQLRLTPRGLLVANSLFASFV